MRQSSKVNQMCLKQQIEKKINHLVIEFWARELDEIFEVDMLLLIAAFKITIHPSTSARSSSNERSNHQSCQLCLRMSTSDSGEIDSNKS
jgi:hypothetical protein